MASSVVKQMTDKLEKLRAQRSAIDDKIHAFEVAIACWLEDEGPDEQRQTGGGLTNEIWKVLQAAGEPMHYKDVLVHLLAKGIHVPGGNPANNVGAHMSADPRFKNVGRGTWGLRSWQTKAVEHQAPDADSDDVAPSEAQDESGAEHPGSLTSNRWARAS